MTEPRMVEMTPEAMGRMMAAVVCLERFLDEPWRFRYLAAKVAARATSSEEAYELLCAAAYDDEPPREDTLLGDEAEEPEPGHEEGR